MGVKVKVPIVPVPNKLKLEVVLPLKVPEPEIVLANPAVPIINVLPFKSIMSALTNVIAAPSKGAGTVTLFCNCTVVPPEVFIYGTINGTVVDETC